MYDRQKINYQNINSYIQNQYPNNGIKLIKQKKINCQSLLQKDYGLDYDCTLTSITCLINFLQQNKFPIQEIYNNVEKEAKKYFYEGNKTGTFPIFTQRIMLNLSRIYSIHKKSGRKYLKHFGYTWNNIINLIDHNLPVVLSLWNDGRNYYRDHSVLIVGYEVYQINNKEVHFLLVFDNWNKEYCYVDFQRLSICSSINYYR